MSAKAASGAPGWALAKGYANRFGAAPDHGALVVYPQAPVVRHDGAYTSYLASISEAHARDAIGGVLTVPLPSGEQLRFRYERHVEHADGNWTWIGDAIGAKGQQAIITFGEKAAFGTIGHAGEQPWRLTVQGGASWLVRTDGAQLATVAAAHPSEPDYLVPPGQLAGTAHRPASSGATTAASGTAAAAGTGTASNTVDLVVGYTSGFVSYYGGDSQAQTRLNNMADITNEAYVNSGIDARVRLVKTLLVSYADNTSNDTALEELTGFKAPSTRTTPNAAFSALRAARDQYGADLVSLVRRFQEPENGGCGIAWLIGGGQSTIDGTDEFFGYSVVSDGRDQGTDGKTYYCREETLAHELGHNMGAQHDRVTAQGSDGVLSKDEYGRYAYSFGMKTDSANGNFYTIMAYGDSGQTSYRIFSDPRSTFCGGLACGVDNQTDNARTLAQTIPIIATFRATVVPVPGPVPGPAVTGVRGDANADGRADMIWHNPSAQQFQPWYMNGTSWTYGNASSIPSKYRIGAIGDFNGDGRADVLWYDTARTELWAWIANADGTYSTTYLRSYPAGWEPVGVGDANADGRADIFWQNPSQQGMQVWLMNGASWTYGPNNSVGSQYRIASIGDFNGDGFADVLWRDTSNTTLWQWQANAGGGYSVIYMRDYPQGWSIVATGDINGDGKADVLWDNPTAQQTQSWFMQGTTWTYGPLNGIPSQYRVSTSGDFNGDGRMDVLWTDNATLWTWQGNGDGTYGINYLRDYPTGWFLWNYGGINYNGGVYNGA
ncbi:reprolysin-like metallopeptidase [Cognatilysobacter lacus]|nr:FG-GAP-like repeat-containing protein [Lysobacter lacus]